MKSLKRVLVPALAVTAVSAVVSGLLDGSDGLLGAVLGGLVVVLFLGSTPLLLTPMVKSAPSLSLPVAVGFLATKSLAMLIVLVLLFDVGGAADHVGLMAFGLTVVAVAFVWTALQVIAYRNDRTPTYDLGNND